LVWGDLPGSAGCFKKSYPNPQCNAMLDIPFKFQQLLKKRFLLAAHMYGSTSSIVFMDLVWAIVAPWALAVSNVIC
jgi:hypothetical protein